MTPERKRARNILLFSIWISQFWLPYFPFIGSSYSRYISGLLQHFPLFKPPYFSIPPESATMLLKVLYMLKTKSHKEPCYHKIGCKTREFARDNNVIYFLWNYMYVFFYHINNWCFTASHDSAVWLALGL